MLFHTHEFLLLLAIALFLFWRMPSKRHAVLLAVSLSFYGYAGLGMLALFLGITSVSYACLRAIEQGRRGALSLGISINLLNLFTFKYTLFFLDSMSLFGLEHISTRTWLSESIILPVGISFYTFQLIAVLVDSYRGRTFEIEDFAEFLLFITFFAQLIAGPIMRGAEFFPQLHRLKGPTGSQVASGLLLFAIGLIKKVLFADYLLAPRVDFLFSSPNQWDTPTSWLLGVLFGFQIYFDFSGYVDMALGLARLFGIELMPNFATPYVSSNPSEFWSRWNITLSRWFGDYVYIPLGGSRGSLFSTMRNLMLTMLASGLWHGAGFTFLVWGGIHGIYLSAYHGLRRRWPVLTSSLDSGFTVSTCVAWFVTFAITTVAWVYFRADTVTQANEIVSSMFFGGPGSESNATLKWTLISLALMGLHFLERRVNERHEDLAGWLTLQWTRIPGPIQAMIAFLALIVATGATKRVQGAFIYFQF